MHQLDKREQTAIGCAMKNVEQRFCSPLAAVVLVAAFMFPACTTPSDRESQRQADQPQQMDAEQQQHDRPSSRSESSGSEYEHPFPRNSWSCSEDNAQRIGEWLEGHATLSHEIGFPSGHPEVEGPQLEERPDMVIRVSPDSIALNDHPIGTVELVEALEKIGEEVDIQLDRIELLADPADEDTIGDGLTLGIVVDPEVAAGRVGSLLEIVDDQIDDQQQPLGLFVGPRNPKIEPVPPELEELLEEYGASTASAEAQRLIASYIAQQIDECEPLIDHFRAIERSVPEERRQMFVEAFPSAWHECDCTVDVELMLSPEAANEFGAHSVVYAPFERNSAEDWRLVDGEDTIELDEEAKWKDVVPEKFRPVAESDD